MNRAGDPLTATVVGDRVEIRLPENPTTGYRWELVSGVIEVLDSVLEPTPGSAGALGAGGTRVLVVRVGDGDELVLELRRPWEAEALERRRVRLERT